MSSASSSDSAVAQDYVKIIYSATEWGGDPVSVTGLAQRMGVAASTASENVRRLVDQGLVEHVPYKGMTLSEEGRAQALRMIRRHRLLETYLHDRLGFEWDQVHEEAEALEHAVADMLVDRIDAELGYPTADPHGDPIPSADGTVTRAKYRDLAALGEGESAQVLRISDHDPELLRFFNERGVVPGTMISLVERRPYAGTIVVAVGQGEDATRLELAQTAAESVWITADEDAPGGR